MTVYSKESKEGLRWYFQFIKKGKYYRGGGFQTRQIALQAQETKKKHIKIRAAKRKEFWRDYYTEQLGIEQERKLRSNYAITAAEYAALFTQQNGVCAICGKPPNGKPLNVDHDHKTQQVRGLLCGRCNTGLGIFGDGTELLERALNYLTVAGSIPVARSNT